MTSPNKSGFLLAFVGLVLGAFAALATVNVVVDPYWRFDLINVEGFNAQRVLANGRIAKAGTVCRLKPAQVILGTSRAEVGLDPTHPGFADKEGTVFNAALAGSGLHEIDLMLRHTVYASPNVQRVLIGLDFLMFNAHREAVAYGAEIWDYDEGRLLQSASDNCWRNLLYDYHDLLGMAGFRGSLRSVKRQMTEPGLGGDLTRWIGLDDKNGFRRNFEVLRKTRVANGGYRALFGTAQERYYAAKIWRAGPRERYCFVAEGQPNTIDVFREMVRFARTQGVDVRFFINPVHARMLVALWQTGLWPQYEDWKRSIVTVLAEEAKDSGKSPFVLWDFSGFNSITSQTVPPDGDTTTLLHSFWEPSHYQKATGELMLDRILGHRTPNRPLPADFGIALTAHNIDAWIKKTREGVPKYKAAEPSDFQLVSAIVDDVMSAAQGANCGDDLRAASAGALALKHGDRSAAKRQFERAVRLHEASLSAYASIGAPFRETGFATALANARRGVSADPVFATWQEYKSRGIARSRSGDYRAAAHDFELAIRLAPASFDLHVLKGKALLRAGDKTGAAQEFEKGLLLEPKNKEVASYLEQARGN
jgi:Tetratricopeptide repeat